MLELLGTVTSVAVIGATESPGPASNVFFALRDLNFTGPIYPVNPRREEVHGHKCYPTVDAIEGTVDGAFLAVPPAAVATSLELCAEKGVKVAVVTAGGYGEGAGDNREGLEQLSALAERTGIRLLGPNCVGIASPAQGIALWGASRLSAATGGSISIVSQSGAPLLSVVTDQRQLRCRYLVNTGNEASIDLSEVLEELAADEGTRTIGLYIEEVRDPERFVAALRHARRQSKAVVALKGGRTPPGQLAAAAHTAALAGVSDVYRGAFRQFGVLEAADLDEWLNCIALADALPRHCGPRVAGLTGSGGCAVMLSDALHEHGLPHAELEQETLSRLREALPAFVEPRNPLDLTMVGLASDEISRSSIEITGQDAGVDLLVLFLPIPNMALAAALADHRGLDKPGVVILANASQPIPQALIDTLWEGRVPLLLGTTSSISALRRYVESWGAASTQDRLAPPARTRPKPPGGLTEHMLEVERAASSGDLSTGDLEALLAEAGVALPAQRRCSRLREVLEAGDEIGYPVVLKTDMAEISHKTEVDAVQVNIQTAAELESSYRALAGRLAETFSEAVPRYVVQEQVSSQLELILALHDDPTFGAVLALGLGGKLVEFLRDITFRVLPIDGDDVVDMVSTLDSAALFEGVRGAQPIDMDSLIHVTLGFTRLSPLVGKTFKTLELNPLMASADKIVAVDILAVPHDR